MSERHLLETTDFFPEATDWIAARIISGQSDFPDRPFRLSLSGGSTPARIYASLARYPGIDWQRVLITFGDERCVPPEAPESNYRMARESLLDPAAVPENHVVRLEGELPPTEASHRAEESLRAWAGGETGPFRHDLVLLGMGEDGHTASLFPGTAALQEQNRWVIENHVPQLEAWRITLTFPVLNASRVVAFLVNGSAKRPVVEEVWRGEGHHPSSGVQPSQGELWWILGR